jgi:hypothetical protein
VLQRVPVGGGGLLVAEQFPDALVKRPARRRRASADSMNSEMAGTVRDGGDGDGVLS